MVKYSLNGLFNMSNQNRFGVSSWLLLSISLTYSALESTMVKLLLNELFNIQIKIGLWYNSGSLFSPNWAFQHIQS